MSELRQLSVHLLPCLVDPAELAGGTCAVIDVLRATTTIVQALSAGALEVLAALELSDAKSLSARMTPGAYLLGGERHGLPIAGFDLGNSPEEYTPTTVGGKSLVFTTTNGTRAVLHCRPARQILLAAFANYSAVCRRLGAAQTVHIVCAGTAGEIAREDCLLAGAIAERLCAPGGVRLNDQGQLVRGAWRAVQAKSAVGGAPLAEQLAESRGGRNLIELGLSADIAWCAAIDRSECVPAAGEFFDGYSAVRIRSS